jgi:hypothetical protein
MPSSKDTSRIQVGPGLAAEDSVPESALLFSTLPSVGGGGGGAGLAAHLADPLDAHPASAIGLHPDAGVYDVANVQEALDELGSVIPLVNEIGEEMAGVPNSGVPEWSIDTVRQTGGFRNAVGGEFGGLGAGALVETYNIIPTGTGIVVGAKVYPADRGTIGILRIDPDGTEVDIGAKVDLSSIFVEGTRLTGQVDYTDLNPGTYDLSVTNRRPILSEYPSNPSLDGYDSDYAHKQIAVVLIYLYDGWGSAPKAGEHYRLLHVEDGEPFNSSSAQYGISVPTPGVVPLSAENALLRERVFESAATAPAHSAPEPTITATVPGAPPNRVQSSGVWAFGLGDTFTVTAEGTAADDCFDTGADIAGDVTLSGGRDPLELEFDGFGLDDVPYAFDEVSEGWTAAGAPDVADTFGETGLLVTVASDTPYEEGSLDAILTARLRRPGVSDVTKTQVATTDKLIVTTVSLPVISTANNRGERFLIDEPYRVPQNSTMGAPVLQNANQGYDSTKLIDAAADVQDALQAAGGRLIWPQTNYQLGHQPSTGQPDYSGFAADPTGQTRFYQRFFEIPSWSSRGTIEIDGIDLNDFGRDPDEVFDTDFWTTLLAGGTLSASHMAGRLGTALVLFKIPGISGWMDLGAFRGEGSFDIQTDGVGCLTQDLGSGQYEFDLGWSPAVSSDATPLPQLAVRVYFFMDGGATVLSQAVTRIAFT